MSSMFLNNAVSIENCHSVLFMVAVLFVIGGVCTGNNCGMRFVFLFTCCGSRILNLFVLLLSNRP